MNKRDELQKQFDSLSRAIGPAQGNCNKTYIAWQHACSDFKRLAEQRNDVWRKLIDTLIEPPDPASRLAISGKADSEKL